MSKTFRSANNRLRICLPHFTVYSVTPSGWFVSWFNCEEFVRILPRENLDFVSQRLLLTYKIFFSFPRMSCLSRVCIYKLLDILRFFQYSVFNVQCTDEFNGTLKACFHKGC